MRSWFDLHPKIAAAVLTLLAVLVLGWFADEMLGYQLRDSVGKWATTVLPLLAGYLKSDHDSSE
jgi:hypothetical protein